MKHTMKHLATTVAIVAGAASLGACSSMSERDKAIATGAAIGGVAGSVLSNGSAVGTVGGAAVGGIVGNEVGKRRN